ncbi:Mitochondrial import receptor subunit TOM70-like protein [Leptotrombidium deliense]|uniref:Mitochondrial import receptor subunit TOM70-like protein n=1 Tax=Leptotrombidium deliense TaxID=299467 RepID=A0A443SDY4_9ACAR|nr:Mitochondrial import receptor subunit TOM70-like protein [Leptotrombidium deliense]
MSERIKNVKEAKASAQKCVEIGNYVTAIDWYRKAIFYLPNNTDELVALYVLCASACDKLGDYENVISYCNIALCLNPHCVQSLKRRATALSKKGYEEASLKDKNCISELQKVGEALTKKKAKKEKFVKSLEKALSANEYGNLFFNLNNYAVAIDYYTKATNYCGSSDNDYAAKFHVNRAAVYEKVNDLNGFRKDCNAAIKLDKKCIKAYRRRGRLLRKLGDANKAAEDLMCVCVLEEFEDKDSVQEAEKTIVEACQKVADDFFVGYRCTPNSTAYVNRKYLREFARHPVYRNFNKTNREADSLTFGHLRSLYEMYRDDFQMYLGASSLNSDLIILKATLNIITEHYMMAEKQLEQLISMYDKDPDPNKIQNDTVVHAFICLANTKGKRLINEGFGMDFALQCFEKAISASEDENEDIYYHRAKLYIDCGQYNNARKDLEKSAHYGKNFIEARCKHLRLKFELAFKADNKNEMNVLFEKFDKLVDEFPDSCVVFSHYAEVLTLIGKYEEARKKLATAIELDKRDPDLCLQMGKTLFKATKNIEHLYDWCFRALKPDCRCIVALEILGLVLVNFGAIHDAFYFFTYGTSYCPDKNQVQNLYILSLVTLSWHYATMNSLMYNMQESNVALFIFRVYFFEDIVTKYMSRQAKEIIGDITDFRFYNIYSSEKRKRFLTKTKQVNDRRQPSKLKMKNKTMLCWGVNNEICFTCKQRENDGKTDIFD